MLMREQQPCWLLAILEKERSIFKNIQRCAMCKIVG